MLRGAEVGFDPVDRRVLSPRKYGLLCRLVSCTLDLLWIGLSPLLLLVLAIASRGFTRPKLTRGLLSKCRPRPLADLGGQRLWVHAVSVGEVLTVAPLVEALRASVPSRQVIVSVSTYTGFATARRRLPHYDVVWAPADLSLCVDRAFRLWRPEALLLVELELWPGLLLGARRHGVPALVVNGRLTTRSARSYARTGPLARGLFSLVDGYAVQNEAYAERVRSLGVDPRRVEVLGNLKHDRDSRADPAEAARLRRQLLSGSEAGVVWVAGCTHPGEERALLEMLPRLRGVEPRLAFVLAPRHVERLEYGEGRGRALEDRWGADRPLIRWTVFQERAAAERHEPSDQVLLVDRVGILESFYAAADLAFVGGTLVERGGHNVLEPAALGCPTAFGPSVENFEDEVAALLDADGARQVADAQELERCLAHWLQQPEDRRQVGQRGAEAVRRLAGARRGHLEWVGSWLALFSAGSN